jgi:hypothetical protein
MPLSTEDLHWVRRQVGDRPDDATLNEAYERLGTREDVAREVLEKRLANFLSQPAEFVLPGDYSQDASRNISALQEAIEGLGGGVRVDIVPPPARRPR